MIAPEIFSVSDLLSLSIFESFPGITVRETASSSSFTVSISRVASELYFGLTIRLHSAEACKPPTVAAVYLKNLRDYSLLIIKNKQLNFSFPSLCNKEGLYSFTIFIVANLKYVVFEQQCRPPPPLGSFFHVIGFKALFINDKQRSFNKDKSL